MKCLFLILFSLAISHYSNSFITVKRGEKDTIKDSDVAYDCKEKYDKSENDDGRGKCRCKQKDALFSDNGKKAKCGNLADNRKYIIDLKCECFAKGNKLIIISEFISKFVFLEIPSVFFEYYHGVTS